MLYSSSCPLRRAATVNTCISDKAAAHKFQNTYNKSLVRGTQDRTEIDCGRDKALQEKKLICRNEASEIDSQIRPNYINPGTSLSRRSVGFIDIGYNIDCVSMVGFARIRLVFFIFNANVVYPPHRLIGYFDFYCSTDNYQKIIIFKMLQRDFSQITFEFNDNN